MDGAWEVVAGYVEGQNLTDGIELVNAESKYKDVYKPGNNNNNYLEFVNHYGDAMYETSSSGTGYTSWYNDYSIATYNYGPFIYRGGATSDGASAGIFGFNYHVGYGVYNCSFRVTIAVL